MNSTILKPVVQLERTGCGIACVAAIAGVSYPQAKKVADSLGIYASDARLWSDTAHVRRLLAQFGIKTGARKVAFDSWGALPDLTLLSIKWHLENDKPHWHWVVFTREDGVACVLDPKRALRSNRRTDFGRMRPRWYIPIARA